jgi:hypothetical protein
MVQSAGPVIRMIIAERNIMKRAIVPSIPDVNPEPARICQGKNVETGKEEVRDRT